MTIRDINDIIAAVCPNDEDYEKPVISPAYLKNELEALALEQEPCEDCISRQAVLNLINADWKYEGLEEDVSSLPPVNPQPRTGHWIYTGDYITDGMLKCSECGFEHDVSERFAYCPNCGARMIEPQESEE